MALKSLYFQLVWTVLAVKSVPKFDRTKESIFDENYCNVKCGNITHTMCPIENPKPLCSDFQLYRFDSKGDKDQLKLLVHGHNGVRNRIAERMYIPNMLELTWDFKLALMAENFLYRCEDRITDPCTLQPQIFYEENTIGEFFKYNDSISYIAQNTFYEKSHFYPYNFLERVIRSWYLEKDGMRPPTIVSDVLSDSQEKHLLGENNFTHFSYPFIYRLGCAMAKFKGGFHILCNYYPFYRTVTNTMYFQTGAPNSDCPARFPLKDELFNSLCTDESDSFFTSDENTENKSNYLNKFDGFFVLAFEFTILCYLNF